MPFASAAQRRYIHANHPELAEEYEEATPTGKKLPERLHKANARKRVAKKRKKRSGTSKV